MTIRFAFAVNHNDEFEERHFGDSEKFAIFEWNGKEFINIHESVNSFKDDEEDGHEHHHGDKKKGKQIVKHLTAKGVKVLVSKQFGRNIKIISQHFIPVITSAKNINEVLDILPDKIPAIMKDINSTSETHKLIDLRKQN